jgi:hypothetical protein
MTDFINFIKPITLDEIINVFQNYIMKESKIEKNDNIIFINFSYPLYFVNKFGSRAVTDKLYEYILMNTTRRYIDKNNNINIEDIENIINNNNNTQTIQNNLDNNLDKDRYFDENILEYIIFCNYKYCDTNNKNKYFIVTTLDEDINCIIFPIINRKYCYSKTIKHVEDDKRQRIEFLELLKKCKLQHDKFKEIGEQLKKDCEMSKRNLENNYDSDISDTNNTNNKNNKNIRTYLEFYDNGEI